MKVALIGNPNTGKTSIFNQLTGLNQKVGNYPGITVDKKSGRILGTQIELIDLPGTYSIYPGSADEQVVLDSLMSDRPDVAVVVLDTGNLRTNLLLYTQIHDLGFKVIFALNETSKKSSEGIDFQKLEELFSPDAFVRVNARKGSGIKDLIEKIEDSKTSPSRQAIISGEFENGVEVTDGLKSEKAEIRYKKIDQMLKFCLKEQKKNSPKADRVLTHPIIGYVIFISILLIIFQAIYAWAELPMDLIDGLFASISSWVKVSLPEGVLTDLLAEGIVPGIGGVVIFIPQIVLLFGFIFFLEESGYMARVVFIMDRLMRPFGLNGKSVVPLISSVACAIPAIMAARTISNWKERIITILVAPLMSCSARLPVYTVLIALVIPKESLGPFNIQGLVLMGLYLIGLIAALVSALVLKWIVRAKERSSFVLELPPYRYPRWENLGYTIFEKTKVFTLEAGKVILAISVVLWVLASYGPPGKIEESVNQIDPSSFTTHKEYESKVSSESLANSYIGIVGKTIEPVIAPLGYNWQIGIALLTSFAAREVFVGSMATIYSVGDDFEDDTSLIEKMRLEKREDNGMPVYNLASGISLMLFYAFAMQCMSTLAIVLRETKSWKWPAIQLIYMTGLAYFAALIAYQLLK